MKQLLLLAVLLLHGLFLVAQDCPINITFDSQGQIDSFSINYPNCTDLPGDVLITRDTSINSLEGLNQITSIAGRLVIDYSPSLMNLEGLNNLTNVEGRVDIMHASEGATLEGLDNLTFVGGDRLTVEYSNLTDLHGLESLTSINGNLVLINSSFISLDGLNNLTTVGGSIFLRALYLLPVIAEFDALTTIGGGIFIQNNWLLTNIDGFNQITTVPNIEIYSNHSLTHISGFENLSTIEELLYIRNNPVLNDCSIQVICNHVFNNGSFNIEHNASGCNSDADLLQNCLGFGFSGYTFFDFNQNGEWDDFEGAIPAQQVQQEPSGAILLSNQNGRYFSLCENGQSYSYTLIEDPDWELTTDSTSYSVLFESNNSNNQNNNFGLYPTFSAHDLAIFTTAGQARCNTDVNFFVDICNEGTFLETDGLVVIEYDELIDYISAEPAPFFVDETNHSLIWSYDTLYPYQCEDFRITFTMPSADFIGQYVSLTVNAFIDSLNTPVLAERKSYRTEILCSFDPNDKLVEPRGVQDAHYTLKEETFNYTIRFQNTGNISALEVTVLDTLDTNLDWSTFRVLQASHSVQTALSQDGEVSFFFENINLPDSTSNPLGSQGFVHYVIDPISGLDDNVVIENTAHIIFDQNPAIITNTAFNTMVDEIPIINGVMELEGTGIQIFPNPTQSKFSIITQNETISQVLLYNAFGVLIKKKQVKATAGGSVEMSFDHFPMGCYFVQIHFENGTQALEMVIKY